MLAEVSARPPTDVITLQHHLYLAGIDPTTNYGMYCIRQYRDDLIGQFSGCDEAIIFHRVQDWFFAFGADASIVRKFATHVRSIGNGERSSWGWEAVREFDAAGVIYTLQSRGFIVATSGPNHRANVRKEWRL